MRRRNLLYLAVFFGTLVVGLYLLLDVTPGNLSQKLAELKETLRTRDDILVYVTVVYAVMLSIPYIPGGLGLCILVFCGFKGLVFFMLGSMLSIGANFLIGRRFPIVMKIFKKMLHKKLSRKHWWPEGEDESIFHIVQLYFRKDKFGRKLHRVMRRFLFLDRLSEKTMVFVLLITPINLIFGGGGGAALVCGEESSLSVWKYMEIAFWAHLLYAIVPFGISLFVP